MVSHKLFIAPHFGHNERVTDIVYKETDKTFVKNPDKYLALPFRHFGVVFPAALSMVTEESEKTNLREALLGFYIEELDPETFQVMPIAINASVYGGEHAILEEAFTQVYEIKRDAFYAATEQQSTLISTIKFFLVNLHSRENNYGAYPIKNTKTFRLHEKKVFKRFSSVVVLKPRDIKSSESEVYRGVEWMNSVWIPGHWRRQFKENTRDVDYDFLGKDRGGNRLIRGYTWVVEHIRGDGPTIDRIWCLE